mmetsp:Transcript_15059/g.42850  ORF Transcript_15059/g.42850 Transcript_15059/m.42850 type:complete len:216 (-) Transcript_15059:184-831(-)
MGRGGERVECTEEHVAACFEALLGHFSGGSRPRDLPGGACALFVTWETRSHGAAQPRLRGCIGTLEPRWPLGKAVHEYALTSALRDRRFSPIREQELAHLECTVSLLTAFEDLQHWQDWQVGRHGLIIDFTCPQTSAARSATYLPEVASREGWSKMECVDSLIRKAGYHGPIKEELRVSLRMTRYQSSPRTMSYRDYVSRTSGRPAFMEANGLPN